MSLASIETPAPQGTPRPAVRCQKVRVIGPAVPVPPAALVTEDAAPATPAERQTAVDRLIDQIRRLDRRIDEADARAADAMIRKGQALSELKSAAGRGWREALGRLRIHTRVANRLIRIADWAHDLGLLESDLVNALPHDALKLEALTKLDLDGIRRLRGRGVNLRATPRPAVVKAIKELLGAAPMPAARDDPGSQSKALDKLIRRLIALLQQAEDGTKERMLNQLTDAFGGLRTDAPLRP